jgi:hypothetical protein
VDWPVEKRKTSKLRKTGDAETKANVVLRVADHRRRRDRGGQNAEDVPLCCMPWSLTVDDFAVRGIILQVGVALRIDVTTTIDGVAYDEAIDPRACRLCDWPRHPPARQIALQTRNLEKAAIR